MYEITVYGGVDRSVSEMEKSSVFVLDGTSVIDAGSLLGPFKEKAANIETVWLTHEHIDHMIDIAFVMDAYYGLRTKPLKIRGLKETLESLQDNLLNNRIWPDFSKIPLGHGNGTCIEYEPIELGVEYRVNDETTIKAFATDHTVPSCGYVVTKQDRALLITQDTHSLDSAIAMIESDPKITSMILECSFPSAFEQLAEISKHLTPKLLFEKLEPLKGKGIELYVNHIKQAYENQVVEELHEMKGEWNPHIVTDGHRVTF